jgi:hypothetical protein
MLVISLHFIVKYQLIKKKQQQHSSRKRRVISQLCSAIEIQATGAQHDVKIYNVF